jgi:hypothetical protein
VILRRIRKGPLAAAAALGLLAASLALLGFYAWAGLYGFNVVLRRGGSIWVAVKPDDERLSPAMSVALRDPVPKAKPWPFTWDERTPGFETAELPVIAEETGAVDRILLARIDPARFRFEVRTDRSGCRDLDDWMAELGATLVVNGSYYARNGEPDTPLKSNGVLLGPSAYNATHGVFVSSPAFTGIRDLSGTTWQAALNGARDAMVSYPLLLAEDGSSRVKADRRWLANRSFVAEDRAGRIVIGTTGDAFFSLDRLAAFLREAPLDLKLALNLDGGPVACQGIAVKDFRRRYCGDWETAVRDGELKLLQPLFGSELWALPIVLAVFPK